jgi:ATP-dependent DNA helicase RecG
VDTLAATKASCGLRDSGLFTQKGRGSATWYQPAARMLARDELGGGKGSAGGAPPAAELAAQGAGGAGLSSYPGGLTSNPQASSSNLAGLTSNSEALDTNPATRDDPLSDPRRQGLLNELPGGLAARVGALGRRHPPDEVKDLVVTLGELRDWRAEELAALLGRKAETVRQDCLRPLLRTGRIATTRPDKPNDPDQAYRATAAE